MRTRILLCCSALLACTPDQKAVEHSPTTDTTEVAAGNDTAVRNKSSVPGDTLARPSAVVTSAGEVSAARASNADYPVLRALYLNRFAPHSAAKMRHLIAVADSTEINAFVIDMKDEFGLNYRSANESYRRNAGSGRGMIGNVRALLDTLKAHNIATIARVVAFKDPVAATVNPSWTIRKEDGTTWNDKEGLAWVSAYHPEVWEYNLGIAEELARMGFDEIQWDYIRFPEPYRSLPKQVFPGATMSKPDVLAAFLKEAQKRLSALGARNTADIFGLVTTVRGPLEIGQHWEKLSPNVDVLLPMVYPSHYPRGAFGIERPNAEPYKVLKTALDAARKRDEALGITRKEHVRPWIQAFSLGKPPYGPAEIRAQKQAIYDAGYQGWILWSPGSRYDPFIPAFDKQNP